ncbi:MAG: dienelactone hydrolase family protein [Gammaproteobacteria bacterium]|nr:dienelactone hydrolase family protein [Gammaproteobacteria bacterium]
MVEFVADTEHPVLIPVNNIRLDGLLYVPHHATALILFVHGSGSSRLSPRNQLIARTLQQAKFATLLFDLLTIEEDKVDTGTLQYRFDIALLAERLIAVTKWALSNPVLHKLSVGYFGASTGGGAALLAAVKEKRVKAVVSRGGRPDLAGDVLSAVEAATLLLVGENDKQVIALNEEAFAKLECEKEMTIVPGASHLFEESGKLAIVARLAEKWFEKYCVIPQ